MQTEVSSDESYLVDDDARIKYMDKYGIDIEALSFNPPIWETVPETDLRMVTKVANDSLSEIVAKHPDRMIGIASIPVPSVEYLDEVDRAIQELGMKGCIIFSNIRGKPLDAPEFLPFYEKMAKYDLPILIHPTYWRYYDWIGDYRLVNMLGWPFDTSLGVSRLVFGGVLDRFPNLKIVVHHLGGMIPFFADRIKDFYETATMYPHIYGPRSFLNAAKMKKHPMEYFKLLYGDTVVNGNLAALKCGLEFFGADHVVYATDYPFGPDKGECWTQRTTKNVNDLNVTEEDRRKIFEGNARRILKL